MVPNGPTHYILSFTVSSEGLENVGYCRYKEQKKQSR